ncbi:MAG: OmpA family protein [Weeksellaceae bacterium]|nr:OmpA family protein [Weeksellaceae bacterium]
MKLQKLLLLAIAGVSFVFTSCKCEKKGEFAANPDQTATQLEEENSTAENMMAKLDENGNFIYDVGNFTEITLPDGTALTVGENSTENKLYSMMNNSDFSVSDDKTQGWVTLDRIYFSSGQSELTGSSQAQLDNIVSLLKAFPEVEVKVGGYTDNTGDAEVNQKVSAERAKTVADVLTAGGIDGSKVESEGYGASHFVCPENDTDECRAQNRRVDIRITKK